ncbi:predicted protein [Naegleria gruberi]|uniref:Predicted protein n=1 Tax=Naegleria gruberi TaxID=5762 RepID=D2VUW3_NAEGR|nr:uncharacterized protein NAEGRDRAFT_72808 [Naegleria gruberi]EFC39335.1 predicted protein [Naegleria gruberi]|eukprot:XP_002672079.1 predicted protein [Naegleria gruberi strain NEG-M]
MTRSHRKIGVFEYDSDEFATTEERKESRKAFRKNVRNVFGQTGKAVVVDLDVPKRSKRRWNKGTFTESQMMNSLDLAQKFRELDEFEQVQEECKENLKQKVRSKMFEEFCERKSPKVVKRILKKLEREGKDTIYDDMSTDSETERQVERWVQDNINSDIKETRKYIENESLNSFSLFRQRKQK